MRIEIGIDPNILELGPWVLAWHGVLTMLGIVVGVWITRIGMRERGVVIPGFDSFVFLAVAGGVIGARLFYVFDHLDRFSDNPLEVLAVNEGGLAIYGGVVGGFLAIALLCRLRGVRFRPLIDAIAPGLAVAQAIGRLGCTVNGDAWGEPTSWAFAFVYTNPDALIPDRLLNVPTHPYPIYDLVMNLAILAVIWPLRRRLPDGAVFAVFSLLYAATRFLISYVREERVWFAGLQEAQVIAVVLFALSAAALVWLLRQPRPTSGSYNPTGGAA